MYKTLSVVLCGKGYEAHCEAFTSHDTVIIVKLLIYKSTTPYYFCLRYDQYIATMRDKSVETLP